MIIHLKTFQNKSQMRRRGSSYLFCSKMKEFQGTVGNGEVKFMALTITHEHLTLLHSNNGFSSSELNVKALRLGITELPEVAVVEEGSNSDAVLPLT